MQCSTTLYFVVGSVGVRVWEAVCGETTQAQEERDGNGVAEGLGAPTGEVPPSEDSPGLFSTLWNTDIIKCFTEKFSTVSVESCGVLFSESLFVVTITTKGKPANSGSSLLTVT